MRDQVASEEVPLDLDAVDRYLKTTRGESLRITDARQIGGAATGDDALKQLAYGSPVLVVAEHDGHEERLVFRRVQRNGYGRERSDDRLAAVWLDYHTFNSLPRHVPAVDLLLRTKDGRLRSIADGEEALLVTAFQPGKRYADDLKRIRDRGRLGPNDMERAAVLAEYLAEVHSVRHRDGQLWRRRLRDLVGHGEGIMGLTESYPRDSSYVDAEELIRLEEKANRWRWKLRRMHHRLCRVHGDFHPFNVLFAEDGTLSILDRSRGPWGEAADDVSSMAVNFIFFSLQRASQEFEPPFVELHRHFWETYFRRRRDAELTAVVQPWLAWRALVLASPEWYPELEERVRVKLLALARNVMNTDEFDYNAVPRYLEAPA
ncbi:MAG: phosphotransferase [Candidatus Eisenbacteria bacterium]|nr:phosphotransferase [Candidatus Eisenbacteria bacterium]